MLVQKNSSLTFREIIIHSLPNRFLFPRREKVCKTETTEDDLIDQLIKDVAADADEMVVIGKTKIPLKICNFNKSKIRFRRMQFLSRE